jgi:hypothetical protein
VTQVVTTASVAAEFNTTISDFLNALNCRNQTLCDRLRRNRGAWHADGQW